MTAAEWLARARAVTDGATPGPWRSCTNRHPESGGGEWGWVEGPRAHWTWTDLRPGQRADATFIAASRTMLPAAVAAIEAVLALHTPVWHPDDGDDDYYHCDECGADLTDATPDCPTVAAITAALDAS